VALIAVAFGLFAPASGAVTRHFTTAGNTLARHALLRFADLGKGWAGTPPGRSVPQLGCPAFNPAVRRAIEIGDAASPTFRQSRSGPFVTQDAYAFATGAQQAAVWKALVRPRLLRCVAASLAHGGGQGVRFTVTGKRLLHLPALPLAAAAYRVNGTANTQGQSVDVFLDMLVLGSGRTITAISISSFEEPVTQKLELRLARAVATRIKVR
jgi:hypothetical protein